ncbi:MAG: nucleoside hydrolase [Eubacteriales bacterium]|nr:nucleoside hydrolase [Eubacteriales bacterium]
MKKRKFLMMAIGTAALFGMTVGTVSAQEQTDYVQYEQDWPEPGQETANIIYDTDIADDVDDAGGLAMLHAYADAGKANLLAVVSDSSCIYGVSCAEAINTYYGRPDIPLGTYKGDSVVTPESYTYCKPVTMKYQTTLRDGNDARDAVDVYREVLAAQPDGSVTIISVGFLTNLTELLNSQPDEYSDLNGVELVRQKVKLVSCMGGNFQDFNSAEYNFSCDPAAAQEVVAKCPAPIMFSGFEIGINLDAGERRYEMAQDDPVRLSYDLYLTDDTGLATRWSWDLSAVLYGVEGLGDYWTMERGDVSVLEDGRTTFEKNEKTGARAFLVAKEDVTLVEDRLNEVMISAKKNNPDEEKVVCLEDKNGRLMRYGANGETWGIWDSDQLVSYASAPGAYMTLEFEGVGFDLYGGTDTDQGMVSVQLDGQELSVIDTYAEKRVGSQCLYSVRELEPGKHTLKLVISEEKNEDSTDHIVRIDAIKIHE